MLGRCYRRDDLLCQDFVSIQFDKKSICSCGHFGDTFNANILCYDFVGIYLSTTSVETNIFISPLYFTHTWKALAWPHHFTKREICVHKTSLTPPHFIEVPVPSQKSEWSCICVLGASILPLSSISIFDFGIVPTMWYL